MSSSVYIFVIIACFVGVQGQQQGSYGCRSDGSVYKFEFLLSPGRETIQSVFAGPLEQPGCVADLDQADGLFKLEVTVNETAGQLPCGVSEVPPGSRDFMLVVITRSLVVGYKASDRKYVLRCHFNGPMEIEIKTAQAILLSGNINDISQGVANPLNSVIVIELISATTDLPVQAVSFLETVYLKVTMRVNYDNTQSWMVRDCKAMPDNSASVNLVGDDGCSDNGTGLLAPGAAFKGNSSSMRTEDFQMFMIPGSSNIVFQCMAVVCPGDACVASCSNRKRRQATGGESGNLIAIIHIADRDNKTEVIDLKPSHDSVTCTNWPYLVAIAALALVLIVTLGFSMLLFMNKTNANRVTDVKPVA